MVLQYVDDDIDDIQYFKECVDSLFPKAKLLTYSNSDSFLNDIHSSKYCGNLIFLDVNMPGKTGLEVLSELKNTKCYTQSNVVIYSTSDNPAIIEKTRELGASKYVVKPNTYTEMRDTLYELISADWSQMPLSDQNFVFEKNGNL